MAKSKPSGAADFVAKVVSDPAEVPETLIVAGYLGASSDDACHRLYLTPDLGDYLELPQDAVLYQQPVPGDPLGGVYVWLRKDAELRRAGAATGHG